MFGVKLVVPERKFKFYTVWNKWQVRNTWFYAFGVANILDNLNFCVFEVKCPVSIKRPVLNFFKKSLLNVLDNLKNQCPKSLTSSTYNRNFRVPSLLLRPAWLFFKTLNLTYPVKTFEKINIRLGYTGSFIVAWYTLEG